MCLRQYIVSDEPKLGFYSGDSTAFASETISLNEIHLGFLPFKLGYAFLMPVYRGRIIGILNQLRRRRHHERVQRGSCCKLYDGPLWPCYALQSHPVN